MLSVVVEVVEDVVVGGLEERSGDRSDVGEDVTSGCSVLSSLFVTQKISIVPINRWSSAGGR